MSLGQHEYVKNVIGLEHLLDDMRALLSSRLTKISRRIEYHGKMIGKNGGYWTRYPLAANAARLL